MEKARLLERLTFQGGTCLRLCFGSERYSEDLDFAGGGSFRFEDALAVKTTIESALLRRYGVRVNVSDPVDKTDETGITVRKWQIKVTTAPELPDIPLQRISLEIASVPAHTKTVRALDVNYPELPSSYGDILLQTETLEEICADKLKAYVTAPYLRYRDLWDLRWISRQPRFDREKLPRLLASKTADYHQEDSFARNLQRVDDIPEVIESAEFAQQMNRFLPTDIVERTLERPVFRIHLAETVQELYRTALE